MPRNQLPPGPGRPRGSTNKATSEIRAAARKLLEEPEYVKSLAQRLRAGKAPHMETLLHHYAYGRPREFAEASRPDPVRVVHTFTSAPK